MSKHNTRLHHALPVAGEKHNRYCGPAAIAALTGVSTGTAAAMLRDVTGKSWIKGTSDESMLQVLSLCGMRVYKEENYYPKILMSFNKWLENHYDNACVLLCAGNHWWAIDNGFYVDTVNRLPTPLIERPWKKKAQVETAYWLD